MVGHPDQQIIDRGKRRGLQGELYLAAAVLRICAESYAKTEYFNTHDGGIQYAFTVPE
jgi:hypothetical protein